MQLKRFTAPDMREALRLVRESLGPDAVILSNRRTDDGMEVVAGIELESAWDMAAPQAIERKADSANASRGGNAFIRALSRNRSSADGADQAPIAAESLDDDGKPDMGLFSDEPTSEKRPSAQRASRRNTRRVQQAAGEPVEAVAASRSNLDPEPGSEGVQSMFESLPIGKRSSSGRKEGRAMPNQSDLDNGSLRFDMAHETDGGQRHRGASAKGSAAPQTEAMYAEMKHLRSLLEDQLSSLAWANHDRTHPVQARAFRLLLSLGLSQKVANELCTNLDERDFAKSWRHVLTRLADGIVPMETDPMSVGGIFALVGPTGVGKTTTIAKLAARFALRFGPEEVSLLTIDNYRIGAHEQLRTYGQMMGVPVHVCAGRRELSEAISRSEGRRLVLIDTAGVGPSDVRLSEQIECLQNCSPFAKNLLVLSCTAQALSLEETVKAYHPLGVHGCVVTKIDEAMSLGPVLSTLFQSRLPIGFGTAGQRVPEDLSGLRSTALINKALSIAKASRPSVPDAAAELAFGGRIAHAS